MINEKQIQSKVLGDGQAQESIGMSLDLDSAQVLMQMLSKNLYSDPIGSTVRECASNALDSHRRANVTEPIIVAFKINNENNYEFTVEDFGTGLDHDDVVNIISKYGKSTKRETNDELGMMGLGFKSPLAYSSSFHFVCRKDGVERKYMMYEGEEGNTIDPLYEGPTTERNGVKIVVPVKHNDRQNFYVKIKEQLAYFESVFFDINMHGNFIDNEFSIFRSEDYQVSQLAGDNNLHICLDNVYYPIDFNKLGIAPIVGKLALRFKLSDGLFPTPNREQLIYTSQAKKIILEKIQKVSDQLVTKYNENTIQCDKLDDVFSYYGSKVRSVTLGDITLDTFPFSDHSKTKYQKPVYKDYKHTDFANLTTMKESLICEYKVGIIYQKGKFRQQNNTYGSYPNYAMINDKNRGRLYMYREVFKGHKRAYIKSLLPGMTHDQIRILKKVKSLPLTNKFKKTNTENYYDILRLGRFDKSQWRDIIKEFQAIQRDLFGTIPIVDDIVVPQAWLDAQKKIRLTTKGTGVAKRVKLHGDINCRVADTLQRYVTGKSSKLVPVVIKAEDLSSSKNLFVYGKQEDEKEIDGLFSVSTKQKIKYLVLSEREHKVVSGLEVHNLMPISEFMKGKNKPFKRLVSSYLIHLLMKENNYLFDNRQVIKTVNLSLFNKLEELAEYCRKHYDYYCTDTIYASMLSVAEEHNLYDETIHTEYNQVKSLLDNFPFINKVIEILPSNGRVERHPDYRKILTDLFKYHRIRMDYKNYKFTSPTLEEESVV